MSRRPVFAVLALALLSLPAGTAAAATPGIHAHRGGSVVRGVPTFPEDTMPAFRNAATVEKATLELDVKLTKDDVPVVIHDDTLDRTTNCTGEVRSFTLDALRACRTDVLGSPGSSLPSRPTQPSVPIPTLEETLAFARESGARVNLEIKNLPTDSDFDTGSAYANRVMDVILASRLPAQQLIVQSFWPPNLDVAKQRMPAAELSLLTLSQANDGGIDFARSRGYEWVSPAWPVSAAYVQRAHAAGLKVVPYTLNKAEDVRAAAAAGVDELITDDPAMARDVFDKRAPVSGASAVSRRAAKVAKRGLLSLRVTADEEAAVVVTATANGVSLGSKELTFARAGARYAALRLSEAGRRALAGANGAVRLTLALEARDPAGNRGTASTTASLR